MKLKVSLVLPEGVARAHRASAAPTLDIGITCDVTTTVEETALAILEGEAFAGFDHDKLGDAGSGRLTLVASANLGHALVLDPLAPLIGSGVQSGWWIRLARELTATGARARPLVGVAEVVGGTQRGARFGLVVGSNSIGRGHGNRILVHDASMSRRHAVIEAREHLVLRDLGSANGIELCGERSTAHVGETSVAGAARMVRESRIVGETRVRLGAVELRVLPMRKGSSTTGSGEERWHDDPGAGRAGTHETVHTRSPRVAPRVPSASRELPSPPDMTETPRVPLLAMLMPMLMGLGMFAITQSAMSLIMVAFSPMMMIGSWLDTRLRSRRRGARSREVFERTLEADRVALAKLSREEARLREAAHPSTRDVAGAIVNRNGLLWARSPTHSEFLTLRLGDGTMPSHIRVTLPTRGAASGEDWERLLSLEREFSSVSGVPVTVSLSECGALGIAGTGALAAGLARALVMQVVGLHAPGEVALAACVPADARGGEYDWEWVKWLPHLDLLPHPAHGPAPSPVPHPVSNPAGAWGLAGHGHETARLLAVLESRVYEPPPAAQGMQQPSEEQRIVVLVHDEGMRPEHRPRFLRLAAAGPAVGVHLLWLAKSVAQLPAACMAFVEVGDAASATVGASANDEAQLPRVSFVGEGQVIPLAHTEELRCNNAADVARVLASVTDAAEREHDASDLPTHVRLRDVLPIDVLGGPQPILAQWRATGSIVRDWQQGEERAPIRLESVVGQGHEGPLRIDLRAHGPHALVGGTTGAGKSEFLQSWIVSLAAQLSPERLSYLLVDYKGGAAFAECAELPHTVGLITDLTPHLVRRALASLRAELRKREELLAACGAKDLITLEQRSDPRAPPVLVIVVDEFAALAREVPEFLEGVLDIAQRGRSLGLHLVLATQRPAGVVTDNVRANTNLRVALRMADASDSSDVLGTPDAAAFAVETPGRGALTIGSGRIEHFQAGYLGGRGGRGGTLPGLVIRELGVGRPAAWAPSGTPQLTASAVTPASRGAAGGGSADGGAGGARRARQRDIEVARDALAAAAALGNCSPPRRPWLDPLPHELSIEALREHVPGPEHEPPQGVLIGLCDLPDEQRQTPLVIDLESAGNVAVFGAGGTGKTSALVLFAASASASGRETSGHASAPGNGGSADPVHLYAIDAAGGALEPLNMLPNVGGVASPGDHELARRVLSYAHEQVLHRGARYAAVGAGTLTEYRALSGNTAEPRIVLLVDGFAALLHELERFDDRGEALRQLTEIMRSGRAVGVHVVLATERPAGLPSALASSVQMRLVCRLGDAHDYAHAGVRADALEGAPPGRAVLAGNTGEHAPEVQLAYLGEAASLAAQTIALEAAAARIRHASTPAPHRVRRAPTEVELHALPAVHDGRAVFGIHTETFAPAGLPHTGLAVVVGPAGAGLSTAAQSCVSALVRCARVEGASVARALLSFRRRTDGSPLAAQEWEFAAYGDAEVTELATRLTRALGGDPPAQYPSHPPFIALVTPLHQVDAAPQAPTGLTFPGVAGRGVIVVERAAEARDSSALAALSELARVARRSAVLVVFEHETGAGGTWELTAALKQPNWGVVLQPDEADGHSIFGERLARVRGTHYPPGRGFALERGRVTPVQVARAGVQDGRRAARERASREAPVREAPVRGATARGR